MSKPLPPVKLRNPGLEPDAATVDNFMRAGAANGPVEAPTPPLAPAAAAAPVRLVAEPPADVQPRGQVVAPPPMEFLPSRPRTTLARRDGRVLHRTTVYLDTELSRQLTTVQALNNKSISDVVAEALGPYLAKELKRASDRG
jgi:hypothetical protein